MPKNGTGRQRIEAILLDIQAEHNALLAMVDAALDCTIEDSRLDLADDSLYAAAHKRVQVMQDLPDCQLRGHLNLLAREFDAALRVDLDHTAGDAARRAIQPLRDKINAINNRVHFLMGTLRGSDDAA